MLISVAQIFFNSAEAEKRQRSIQVKSRGLIMAKQVLPTALLCIILLAGCNGTTAQRPGQMVVLEQVQYAAAFEAGLAAMRENFTIEKQDRQGGEIISQPIVYTDGEASERLSSGLSGRQEEFRKTAVVKLSERAQGCAIEVRVDIERKDTQDYQIYEGIAAAEDLRKRTPAERRDTAGIEQREVWTFIRRDLAAEELIIRNMRERLGPPEAGSSGTAPAQ